MSGATLPICSLLPACDKLGGSFYAGEPRMLVVMRSHASEEQVRAACLRIEPLGLRASAIAGASRTAIAAVIGRTVN
jgi:DAHP synthase ferredoxin-like domain